MNVHTHPDYYPVYHTINTQQIFVTSNLVSSLSGMVVQPNKAIVGANAFLHESGIHQDGILKNKQTYEIMRPEEVGVSNVNLVLGKLSGRNAFRARVIELGYSDMSDDDINIAFERFKSLADSKKRVTDHDLLALISDQVSSVESQRFKLQSIQVVSGTNEMATATVKLIDNSQDKELIDAAIGRSGPIMAVFGAIQRLVQQKIRLLHYEVRAVSEGMDALGKVIVKITEDIDSSFLENGEVKNMTKKATYLGHGTDLDVVAASAKAYVNAINKMLHYKQKRSSLEERQANI
jgi:2-isopropylmalate synthase